MAKAAYCCLPEKVYALIKNSKCNVLYRKADNAMDFINIETNEKLVTLLFNPCEENAEMVFVNDGSIEYTMLVNRTLTLDPKSLSPLPVRAKTKRIKPKEKVIFETPPNEAAKQIADPSSMSDQLIMKHHIYGTLDFIRDSYPDETSQRDALSELIDNLKMIKNCERLEKDITELKNARKRKSIPDMYRLLTTIADNL